MKKILALILSLVFVVSLASCDTGNGGEENEKTYTVTVLDNGAGVAGVEISFINETANKKKLITTNENGVATYTPEAMDGEWKAQIFGVSKADKDKYPDLDTDAKHSFDSEGNLTLNIGKEVVKVTYTIYVKDASGAAVEGVAVQICDTYCMKPRSTDAEGKVTYTVDAGNWKAQLTDDEEGTYHYFDDDNTVTIVVE